VILVPIDLTPQQARLLKSRLIAAPVAPGHLAHLINVGTDRILDVLEDQYFKEELSEGVSSFKYLEGDYGTGKTQFINCLVERARRNEVVSSVVSIGIECPFSSPLAIFRNVMASFMPPFFEDEAGTQDKGIAVLLRAWVRDNLRKNGVTPGDAVPDAVRDYLERPFKQIFVEAPDPQMANGLCQLGLRIIAWECAAQPTVADQELLAWVRGESISSRTLGDTYGLRTPAREENAFPRLKTAITFLRLRMNFRGFFIAFDEGTRIMSFRRGSTKQRQAIENMLTMINQNAEGEFGGVMFLYAATPDFRAEIIKTYIALKDRIGSVAFIPGRPMTPLIRLEDHISEESLLKLGDRLLDVFERANTVDWDRELQRQNLAKLIEAQKKRLFMLTVPPRFFVFHCCRLLEEQRQSQRALQAGDLLAFVEDNQIPKSETV
jgi:hypothetical protein